MTRSAPVAGAGEAGGPTGRVVGAGGAGGGLIGRVVGAGVSAAEVGAAVVASGLVVGASVAGTVVMGKELVLVDSVVDVVLETLLTGVDPTTATAEDDDDERMPLKLSPRPRASPTTMHTRLIPRT